MSLEAPAEPLGEQVEQALSHLYDYRYLQRHPLAQSLLGGDVVPHQHGSQLRRLLLQTMERLDPGPDVPARSPLKRNYAVLTLRYVEQYSVKEIARELGVSTRQVYRYLSEALNNLTALLRERQAAVEADPAARRELISAEAERLPGQLEPTDVAAVTRQALEAVSHLADERDVSLKLFREEYLPLLMTQPQILKQAVLMALSHAVQESVSGSAIDVLLFEKEGLYLEIAYLPAADQPEQGLLSVLDVLLRRLDGHCEVRPREQRMVIACHLPDVRRATLLVIDDNEGLVDLFRRYLADEPYRIVGATSGAEGLRLAQQDPPDAIVLDVMMPEQDGWDVLQALRRDSRTQAIPVIVCSVIDDPYLALSLGADLLVAKPFTESQLREALRACLTRAAPQPRADPARAE